MKQLISVVNWVFTFLLDPDRGVNAFSFPVGRNTPMIDTEFQDGFTLFETTSKKSMTGEWLAHSLSLLKIMKTSRYVANAAYLGIQRFKSRPKCALKSRLRTVVPEDRQRRLVLSLLKLHHRHEYC